MKRSFKIAALLCFAVLVVFMILGVPKTGKTPTTLAKAPLNKGEEVSATPDLLSNGSPPGSSSLPTVTSRGNQGVSAAVPTAPPIAARNASVLVSSSSTQQRAQKETLFGGNGSVTLADIPSGRFKSELQALKPEFQQRVLLQLAAMQVPRADISSLHADPEGSLFYTCIPPLPESAYVKPSIRASRPIPLDSKSSVTRSTVSTTSTTPVAASHAFTQSNLPSISDSSVIRSPAAVPFPATVPITSPPIRHSKPGAPNVIYLNFSGQVVTGTAWNLHHAARYACQPFDLDGNPATFNATEQQMIVDIWERVSEHYRPFNVDVTTEKPASLANNRVATALITRSIETNGSSLPFQESGGVAYIGVYGTNNYAKKYSPAFVFFDNLSTNPSYIGEAASHEVGHNMGLTHDATLDTNLSIQGHYYAGHGSGASSWGPIMGDSYGKSVSQWSSGQYYDANNPQDQVGIIAGKLNFRSDYSSNTIVTAIPLATNGIMLTGSGVIVRNTDVDYYSFSNSYPQIQLSVSPVRPAEMPWNDPLDVAVDVLNSNGALISHLDPSERTDVAATIPLPLGNYYLRVYSSGTGSPTNNPPTGYTTYDCLGSYTVSLTQQPYLPPQIFPSFGESAQLSVTPGGFQPYTFTWSKDGVSLPGVTGGTLTLTNVQQSDAGVYAVTVDDGLGNTSHCTSWVIPRYGDATLIAAGSNAPFIPPSLSNVVSMSARGSVSAILNADSTVSVLGDNTYGQTNVPSGLTNVIAVSAGESHVLALKSDGMVIGWGDNSRGEIDIPVGLSNVVAIAAGGVIPSSTYYATTAFSMALKSDGTVTAWGDDEYGQVDVPRGLSNVVAIAAGTYHSLALIEDGTVTAWGGNNLLSGVANVPQGLSNVVSVAADQEMSIALCGDGSVVTWGDHTNVPAGLTNAVGVTQAGNTATALLNDGTVINWDTWQSNSPASFFSMVNVQSGSGFNIGLQNPAFNSVPSILIQPVGSTIDNGTTATLQVVAGGSAPIFYQWRSNGISIAGATSSLYVTPPLPHDASGTYYDVLVSNPISSLTSSGAVITVNPAFVSVDQGMFVDFSPGMNVTLSGSTWGLQGPFTFQWSFNNGPIAGATNSSLVLNSPQYEQGGYYSLSVTDSSGSNVQSGGTFLVPIYSSTQIVGWGSASLGITSPPSGITNAWAVIAGYNNAGALRSDGSVIIWGQNSYGQTNQPPSLSNVVAMSLGGDELVLKSDGSVINLLDPTSQSLPSGLTNIVAIASGATHDLALHNDGTVTAWGQNYYGQINVPPGLSNVIAISAGDYSSMALKSDGSVAEWGGLWFSPTPPGDLTNAVAVSAGANHFMALTEYGTVKAWGNDTYSETNVPGSLSNVIAIAAGGDYSLALKKDGTLAFWGDAINGFSTIVTSGNGTMTPPSGLTNVVAITAKSYFNFALVNTSLGIPSPTPSPNSTPVPNFSPSPTPTPTNSQSITLPSLAPVAYSPSAFWVNATSSSGLPVELSVISGPATITGNKVTLTGVGTVVIAANQSGNWNYFPAPQVTTSFAVTQASQSINFSPVAILTTTNAPFTLYATASSGLPVSFSSSAPNVLSISGNTATIIGWGTAIVTATQGGNSEYTAATPVTQTVTIGAPQSITPFVPIPTMTYAKNKKVPITLPTASSGQTVTVSVKSGPATIWGNTLTLTGRGTVVLAANQSGNSQFLPAPQETSSFTVK